MKPDAAEERARTVLATRILIKLAPCVGIRDYGVWCMA